VPWHVPRSWTGRISTYASEGTLERVEGVTAFSALELHATLTVDPGVDEAVALGALERAERGCLISNSLKAPVHLRAELAVAA
jgi:organic hydroperoxide reductase OsmC/OhrA